MKQKVKKEYKKPEVKSIGELFNLTKIGTFSGGDGLSQDVVGS